MIVEGKSELKNIIEAVLLASELPLPVQRILALFPDDARPTREEVLNALGELERDCDGRGIELKQVGNGYRFQSKEKYAAWMRKLSETRPARYSRALLETLAIIAYRQPVTRGDIEEIRGVSVSTETIRTLLNREWIRQLGQRDVPGRPALYGTTKTFLDYFNLKTLSELPALAERRETAVIAQELNLTLPLEEGELESPAELSESDSEEISDSVEMSTSEPVGVEPEDAGDKLVAVQPEPDIAARD